jgi:hypothetical protein
MRRLDLPLLVWAALILVPSTTAGQTTQETDRAAARNAVLATVETFFSTMTAKDPQGAARVLEPDGRFFSVRYAPSGERILRSFTNRSYLEELGSGARLQVERMWDPEVRIHGDVANVWAPYDFHIDGARSHCGVDSFDLIRTADGWRITGGVYTVETEGCPPSPLGGIGEGGVTGEPGPGAPEPRLD